MERTGNEAIVFCFCVLCRIYSGLSSKTTKRLRQDNCISGTGTRYLPNTSETHCHHSNLWPNLTSSFAKSTNGHQFSRYSYKCCIKISFITTYPETNLPYLSQTWTFILCQRFPVDMHLCALSSIGTVV